MDKKFDVFYFSGTHWDREWYQDFQGFRYRLVKMIDKLLDILGTNPDFKIFHFDGQSVVLEDYAEISPEKCGNFKKYIAGGKILVGPWYTMPDEFNVSGESLIRNLMFGHKTAKEWGADAWKFGYICDVFGHIAQMPQIFNEFGIKYSLLGRGTAESDPMYFKWQSPSGASVINYKLPDEDGYGDFNLQVYNTRDGLDLTVDERIKKLVDREIKRSNAPIIILMDGGDHTEVSTDTVKFMEKVKELYPSFEIHHENLCNAGKMLEKYADNFPVISGELVKTPENLHHYLHLITNTLSSYYSLKNRNAECENLIEKKTEPLAVMSLVDGHKLNRAFLNTAYKYLLKNHAHDSICGCSADRVNKDMEYRFDQAESLCNELCADYLYFDKGENETDENGDYANVLTLYNPLSVRVDKTVSVDIDFDADYKTKYSEPFGYEDINSFKIFDFGGNEIPYLVTDIKRGYVRRVHNGITEKKDVHTVTFNANLLPFSKTEYKIVPSKSPVRYKKRLLSGADFMENEHLRVTILPSGSFEIFDKKTNRTYTKLCTLASDGEIGDGWYHANPVNDLTCYSSGGECDVRKTEDGETRCAFEITKRVNIPKNAAFGKFGYARSADTCTVEFKFKISLSKNSRTADFELKFFNSASDHRLRLLLPTGIKAKKYTASQAFYFCERKTGMDLSTQNYRETDQYEKSTNGIVCVRGENCGLAFVSSCGVHECAVSENGEIALTLMRSFSRTTRTNGETNCRENRVLKYKFSLAPIDETVSENELLKMRDALEYEPVTSLRKTKTDAAVKNGKSYVDVCGENIFTSIVKCAENGDNTVVVRVFNTSANSADGEIKTAFRIKNAVRTNLNEEFLTDAQFDENSVKISLGAYEIATYLMYLCD